MRIAQEEVFGPFLTSIRFSDEGEALRIANDVAYELTGYVWTSDLARALRVSDALEAGMIWINSDNVRHLPTPFGGLKNSGIGRDGAHWSFDFYRSGRTWPSPSVRTRSSVSAPDDTRRIPPCRFPPRTFTRTSTSSG